MEASMRTVLISGLGLMLATGSVWAQSNYDYRDRDSSRDRGYSDSDRGTVDFNDYNGDRSVRREGWNGDHAGDHNRHHNHHGKGHGSSGARFYLKAGDREFRVRCGDEDSTRECVDAALTMFRAVQDLARGSTMSPATPGVSTSTPPTGQSTSPGTPGGSPTGQ